MFSEMNLKLDNVSHAGITNNEFRYGLSTLLAKVFRKLFEDIRVLLDASNWSKTVETSST